MHRSVIFNCAYICLLSQLPANLHDFTRVFVCVCIFFFLQVVNLQYSEVQDRVMLTGRHMVRDVSCKNCNSKLGWIYEFATEDSQRYKEGRVILERALVRESEGFEEHVPSDNS